MPFYSFYVWVIDPKCAADRERFPRLIKALNVSLRKGVMKVSQIFTEKSSPRNRGRPAFRLKGRMEDTMLEPLRLLNFRPRFTTGPVVFMHPARMARLRQEEEEKDRRAREGETGGGQVGAQETGNINDNLPNAQDQSALAGMDTEVAQ